MNFLLADIERVFPETDLLRSELLLDENRILRLEEIDKHLWVAAVETDRMYEVEVKITPRKVTAASCDCAAFREKGVCEHLGAVLLRLRRQLTDKSLQQAPPPKQKTGKLTIATILEQVEEKELLDFLKAYARHNRHFTIAIKARFASEVDAGSDGEKYAELLDSAISDARRPDRTFTRRGIQKIEKVLANLHQRLDELLAKQWYAEAFELAQRMVEKVTPVLRKTEHGELIQPHLTHLFKLLKRLLDLPLPPALADRAWEYCLEESKKLVYRNTAIDKYFFSLLLQMAGNESRFAILLAYFDELLDRYYWEKRDLSHLILAKLDLLDKAGRLDDLDQLLHSHSLDAADILYFALAKGRQEKNYRRVKQIALQALKRFDDPHKRLDMEKVLLEVAVTENNTTDIIRWASRVFLDSADKRYLEQAKNAAGNTWPQVRLSLLQEIGDWSEGTRKQAALAHCYADARQLDLLLELLRRNRSLELLQEFDHLLLPVYSTEVKSMYKEWLHLYLKDHLGRKTSRNIRQLIEHVIAIGGTEIANMLVEEFTRAYPERHTLIEELYALSQPE
jgi:hypothetical protein